jgi:hypothetical protein
MRALLLSFLLAAIVPFGAQAQQPPAQPAGNFAFTMVGGNADGSKAASCVHLTYAAVTAGFPTLPNGTVSAIRFYYGQGDATSVTQNSQFDASNLMTDAQGNLSISPIEFCGMTPGHYNFKYGLVDAAGVMLEFMTDAEFNPANNTVDVQ